MNYWFFGVEMVIVWSRDPIPQPMGLMASWNQTDCTDNCGVMGWSGTWNCMY